jgi:hypothetical protein
MLSQRWESRIQVEELEPRILLAASAMTRPVVSPRAVNPALVQPASQAAVITALARSLLSTNSVVGLANNVNMPAKTGAASPAERASAQRLAPLWTEVLAQSSGGGDDLVSLEVPSFANSNSAPRSLSS